jgi:hypothetical protein
MKSKIIKECAGILLITVAFILIGGCKKFLDKKQNESLVVPENLSDLQAILDDLASMNKSCTPSYGETSSDEYFLTTDLYNTAESIVQGSQKLYTWQYYPITGAGNDWGACYQPIYNSNLVLNILKTIPKTNLNSDSWNNVCGSAKFFRAYYFSQLLWNYAKAYDSSTADKDLGIVLRLTSDFNVPSVRATNKQSYQQAIKDAKECLLQLPTYPLIVTRPSKMAAYGLLSRIYLSMREYKYALLYADSCLRLNSEIMDFNDNTNFNIDIMANGPFKPLNKEIIFYSEMNRYNFLYNTVSFSRIDTMLYKSYSNNDLRLDAYFATKPDGYQIFKGSYANSYSYCFSGIATDEMYLIKAECLIRAGALEEGVNNLDYLLQRRYLTGTYIPPEFSTLSEGLDFVLNERKKELFMRGLRWMDIKRLNKEGRNIILKRVVDGKTYSLPANSDFYALPIPEDIVQMTAIEQN